VKVFSDDFLLFTRQRTGDIDSYRLVDMNIEYGAYVVDRNDTTLGQIAHIIMDSWSGEQRKFVVRLDDNVSAVYFKPEHVAEATADRVKLNLALDELERT